MHRLPALLAIVAASAGCSSDEGAAPAPSCADALALPDDEPTQRCEVDAPDFFGGGNAHVRVGVFIATTPDAGTWRESEVTDLVIAGLIEAGSVLEACDLLLQVETAQVLAVPPALQDFVGNAEGAWGGLAPDGEADPDAFNYALNERLAADPRALFPGVRTSLSDGAIAIFVVDQIRFFAAAEERVVGGLSYPPVVYHHPEDMPERNAVVLAASYGAPGSLPNRINGLTVAHELGHMLLDTAQHVGDDDNFMQAGSVITEAQCDTMRATLAAVYGDPPVADPRAAN